ncbi:hypothetical protein SUGI_0752710 [Cryptomeria japonica]|uniref:probably inactive leucine-rich repeat receptor-like protein kinase IMK2 n=1 Tax=Cryptomeria japonica TaxID=3369 RepID=UPI0024148065|nr:probably inactive leucine-rich repeat receptor-like protein kinase IMK2 [Cryptomeria japonica]XP_057838287.2 probably inactive leucine-rich repeat receptor-like protein kinase IMK2 [Cryptomeria japonica]XP_057838294.2 probably inactive leucine-rich repeat receptor-like protein kinase IMK2 [Cryptomeria japonica]XP_057838300.2 probably inactive leucine-rich repeat receptor-like protein kinase IMK2 [Cryptomeria japonica]XP_057838305.2 probably inactive leucine-rich repeat receptor-like protein 
MKLQGTVVVKWVLCLLTVVLSVSGQYDGIVVTQEDFQALQAFKHAVNDPRGVLRSWNDSGIGACSGGWVGIKCVKGQVIAIQIPWRGLGGRIAEQVGQLSQLRKLNLHHNAFEGPVPTSLGFLKNLRGVYLFHNRLSGNIPPGIGNSPALQALDLSSNLLIGTIPKGIGNSTKLYRVNLSFNNLTGAFPVDLARNPSLTFLNLQNNNLSGPLPDTWDGGQHEFQLQSLHLQNNGLSGSVPHSIGNLRNLRELVLSHNQLQGSIPTELGNLLHLQTLDLSHNRLNGSFSEELCNLTSLNQLDLENNMIDHIIPSRVGELHKLVSLSLRQNNVTGEIPSSLGNISGLSSLDLSLNRLNGSIPSSLGRLKNLSRFNVSDNELSGSVPSFLARKFSSSSFVGNLGLCGFSGSNPCNTSLSPSGSPVTTPAGKSKKHRRIKTLALVFIILGSVLGLIVIICLVLLLCFFCRKSSEPAARSGGEKSATAPSAGLEGGEVGGKLVHFDGPLVFTADDLLCATAEVMGKSTYGTVYKATLEDGNQVAVKRLRERIAKNQREFEAEANALGKIRHPNLLALRAYYWGPKDEKLLVFDFMSGGSLAAFLHARGPETPLNWYTRMKIAIGAGRGLAYLHSRENIVHGNLTSSNILLDADMNAKISDFGLSRLMTTAANSNVIATAGALGYRAPELTKLKKASTKTDVYSYGVILLELLTGKAPGESMTADSGMDLPQWVASIVKEEWTNEVFDLELMKDAATSGDELLNTLQLAMHCVDPTPSSRPDMDEVVHRLEEIKPEFTLSSSPEAAASQQ